MTREVIIRKAVVEDVSSIAELWKELMDFNKQYDEHISRSEIGYENVAEFITENISNNAFCILVAEANKNIVGYCVSDIRQCEP